MSNLPISSEHLWPSKASCASSGSFRRIWCSSRKVFRQVRTSQAIDPSTSTNAIVCLPQSCRVLDLVEGGPAGPRRECWDFSEGDQLRTDHLRSHQHLEWQLGLSSYRADVLVSKAEERVRYMLIGRQMPSHGLQQGVPRDYLVLPYPPIDKALNIVSRWIAHCSSRCLRTEAHLLSLLSHQSARKSKLL